MERITLGNRPAQMASLCKIEDFKDGPNNVRVCMTLRQDKPGLLAIDAQAFEVDANGINLVAPDGKPSRTPDTTQTILTSGLGDTHTLGPGWVRKVGTYTSQDFEDTGHGKPTNTGEVGDEYFDLDSETGYKWDEGETLRIAKGKVFEMVTIINNSASLAGISF